jgi:hypothetical protein
VARSPAMAHLNASSWSVAQPKVASVALWARCAGLSQTGRGTTEYGRLQISQLRAARPAPERSPTCCQV